jgi:glycosyltransferase involved in cell wall biosynthesis
VRLCFISVGTFAHVGLYLEHFKAAGHDVSFVALSPSPPRGVPTYELGFGARRKWKYPLAMLAARRLVRALKPDVVHAHFATSGGLAGLVCGLHPTVVTVHGSDLAASGLSPLWRPVLRAVLEHADCVNAVSGDLGAMAARLGADPAKITTLTPGVDTGLFSPDARPRSPRAGRPARLFCPRRLDPECDPLTVIHAAAALRRSGLAFTLTMAGEGRLRSQVEAAAARLGLSDAVRFLGHVPHADMPALLREHDLYLSASLRDGASLSLLEAMAAGALPVVSRIPANTAWLDHGAGGLFHTPGDAEDLARRVVEALGRPGFAAAAAALNRARVLERGDRAVNMARLEEVYKTLAARGRIHGNA